MTLDADTLARRLRDLDPGPPPENERRAAVALLLRCGDDPPVLLMRRTERAGDRWSGQVSLPGGHADAQDEHLLATAQRETFEEVGLRLDLCARPVGRLPVLQARARNKRLPLFVAPYVFAETTAMQPVLGPEAARAFWMPLIPAWQGELDAPLAATEDPAEKGEHAVRTFPSWHWDGETVWGMTRHILTSLFAVCWPRTDQGFASPAAASHPLETPSESATKLSTDRRPGPSHP